MKTLLALAAIAASFQASAGLIEVRYVANLASMYYADCQTYSTFGNCNSWSNTQLSSSNFANGLVVAVGQTITGRFIYDSNSLLTGISSDGAQAVHLNSVSVAEVSAGEVSLPSPWLAQTSTGSFSVVNNRGTFDSFFLQGLFSQGDWFASANFHLQDSTGRVFSDFTVPTSLDFNQFNANVYSLAFVRRSDGDQLQVSGQLNSVTFFSAVPEPSSLALLLLGLPVLLRKRAVA